MKAMLSQPMNGKTDEEIKTLEEKGYSIVNTLFTDEWYSSESIKELVGESESAVYEK